MSYIFLGNPTFAAGCLKFLIEQGLPPAQVITNPDQPQGRNRKLQPTPVKEISQKFQIPTLEIDDLRDSESIARIQAFQPELFIVVAYRILPRAMLEIPRLGAINLHASLLPDYRGASPIQCVLLNGETRTGITTFIINRHLDSGAILMQEPVEIDAADNFGALSQKLLERGSVLLKRTIEKFMGGKLMPVIQTGECKHYAPKLTRDDSRINWEADAASVVNRIRAFAPEPGAFSVYKGITYKMLTAHANPQPGDTYPGTILCSNPTGGLIIQCGSRQTVSVTQIQAPGKKALVSADFLRGTKLEIGEKFSNS